MALRIFLHALLQCSKDNTKPNLDTPSASKETQNPSTSSYIDTIAEDIEVVEYDEIDGDCEWLWRWLKWKFLLFVIFQLLLMLFSLRIVWQVISEYL